MKGPMTAEDIEHYLDALLPNLRERTVKTDQDDDAFQQTCINLLEHCDQFTCSTEQHFIRLFCRSFLLVRRRLSSHQWVSENRYPVVNLEEYRDAMGLYAINSYACDPRQDPLTDTLEYIGLLPKSYRDVFTRLYVHGETQEEVGMALNMSPAKINRMIETGAGWIREELRKMEGGTIT